MSKIKFKGERTASTIKIASGLVIFLVTIHTNFIIGSTLIAAAVSAMAVYEFIHAFGCESKALYAVACTAGALFTCGAGLFTSRIIEFPEFFTPIRVIAIISFYALIILAMSVVHNEKIKYVHAMAAFFGSLAIPYGLSCFLLLNNISYFVPSMNHFDGIYLVWMAFGTSWLTDVFAFLVGRKIGKHKMCPKISPKKSVEGAVGGVIITAALLVVISFCFNFASQKIGYETFLYASNIKYLFVALFSVILSIVSMFGDLAASVLKRNVGIKDYSNLLPGHGGIIDRFDSCLFVVPCLFGMVVLVMG